jgi:hypothetical protein
LERIREKKTKKEERVDMKKVAMLQQVLVEHRWESQDSTDINRSIMDLRRKIEMGILEIKGMMTIYLIIILLAMIVFARVLVVALRQP